MRTSSPSSLVLLAGVIAAQAASINFAFENTQLTEADAAAFPAIASGTAPPPASNVTGCGICKAYPGKESWPSTETWAQFNQSLGGALLQPVPAAAACYPGPNSDPTQCSYLINSANRTRFWIDDPLTMLSDWAQGNTCMLSPATGNCTRGAFPEYVVDARTVKHVQAAVNFARNKNLRLVIKYVTFSPYDLI